MSTLTSSHTKKPHLQPLNRYSGIKYRIAPTTTLIKFSSNQTSNSNLLKFLRSSSAKSQVRHLNFTYSLTTPLPNKQFLNAITRLHSLKKITIIFENDPFNEAEHRKKLKVYKKLLTRTKHTTKIIFNCETLQPYHYYPYWKLLALLPSLKTSILNIRLTSNQYIFKLAKFLNTAQKRRYWLGQKSQILSLHLFPSTHSDQSSSSFPFQFKQLADIINSQKIKLHLKLDFVLWNYNEGLGEFQDTLKSLNHLEKIKILGVGGNTKLELLNSLENNRTLKSLHLPVNTSPSKILVPLSHSVATVHSLTQLSLVFGDMKEVPLIKTFIQQLSGLVHLTHLNIDLKSLLKLDGKIITTFANTFSELVNLEELNFDCDKHYNALEIKDSLKNVFQSLARLTKLKKLTLNCGALDVCIQDESMIILGESLKGLVNLRYLFLNFSTSKVGNTGLQALQEVLGSLKELEVLNLNLLWCEFYSQEVFLELVNTIGKLKFLKSLTLGMRVLEVEQGRMKDLAKMMYQLRSLENCSLRLNFFVKSPGALLQELEGSLECLRIRTVIELFIR